ncbi:MAG: 50S ribosomal protein L2 [Candidatus Margulisiibacteriota bacterium]|nr:50S ribosomal protein L2 [Candidatus Margulisiibacteriota bacterium]
MALKQKRPMTPGTRFQIADTFEDITRTTPEKSLLATLKKKAGRDNLGRVSARHRGGGSRKHYRMIDFKRTRDNVPAKVESIEYDPNRNCRIALIKYQDGELSYILAPLGLEIGQDIMSGEEAEISLGNALPLRAIPLGSVVHNVEMTPGHGGQLARSAGTAIMLLAKEGGYAIIRLPSGEQRKVHLECRATVGQLGNTDAKNVRLGKAGRMRHRGRRPKVRGTAMNPCDHPHGGGEGRAGAGRCHPMTPTGKPALGKKTRKERKNSSRFILRRRKA